jgi:PAS domain S-box-containing protein
MVALIVGALLAWWMVDQASSKPIPGEARERPVLFLGNESLPPMSFMKNGKPSGIVVDLAEALMKRIHHPSEIRLMDWTEAQRLVLEGQADALLQINPNKVRLKSYDFSEPLLTSEFTIFTSAERLGIATMSDLRGLKVGVENNGLPILLLHEDPQIIVKIIPNFVQGFKMLVAGELDAVVADRWVGSYVLSENNMRGVKLIEEPISRSHSSIAVKKGNASLLADINMALADIKQDGTYDRIIKSWKSKEVVFKTREQWQQQVWLIATVLVVLIITLVVVAVLIREIRRRRQSEKAVLAGEERLRFALETSHTGSWDLDLGGHNAYRSLEHDRIFGYSELLPQWTYEMFLDHVLPEDRAQVDAKFHQAIDTLSDWSFECRIRRTDGEVRWIWAAGRHRTDTEGSLRRMAGIVQDITERKQVEEALRLSEEKFATAFANNPTAIALSRLDDGMILEVNDTWVALNSYSREEAIGHSARRMGIWPNAETVTRFVQELQKKGFLQGWEQDFRRKSGEVFVAQLSAQLLTVRDEKIILSTLVDITERKRAEQALAEHVTKLEEINKELESYSYSISHDLRAPLRAIDGYARMILKKEGDRFDEDTTRKFNDIRSNAQMMGNLIDDILELSRLG